MCGLVGFSGPKDKSFNLDKIKLLMMMNQERGEDSFGFYTPNAGVIKDTGKIESEMSKPSFTLSQTNLLIGHVRKSTVGGTNKKNAHPFNYGNIVLAMNGTLTNHWNLLREYGFNIADFDVDSQILAAMINKDQTSLPLSKIIGGCAVLYTDTNTGKLYAYRNNERPLYRGSLDGCMYISSIESSLKIIGCNDVKEFKEDILYEINDGKIGNNYKIKKAEEPKKKVETILDGKQLKVKLNMVDMNPTELVGMWLTPHNTVSFPHGALFMEGYGYKVVDVPGSDIYNITVVDHNNSRRIVTKFMFKEETLLITKDSFAFCTTDLSFTKGKDKNKDFARSGDLLEIIGNVKGGFECKNLLTNEEATVPIRVLRPAWPREVKEYKALYYLDGTSIEEGKDSFLEDINKPINSCCTIPDNSLVVYNEEEVYEREVKNTSFSTYDQLVDFTIENITDLINDIEETKLSTTATIKIKNIKSLLQNFEDKNIELYKRSINA